jgi:glycosyltransferase involved in cell wall biosynthesis
MDPFISIIIPVYNGEKYIGKCLESILNLSYPKNRFEVIVVDNNSTDRSVDIIRTFPFRYCSQKIQGPAAARNHGIKLAKGEIVSFTDADVIVRPDWLQKIVKAYAKYPEIHGVQGFSEGINRNIWATLYQKWYEQGYLATQAKENSGIKSLDTRNLSIKKSVLLDNAGFNEQYMRSEDNELGFRLYMQGYDIKFIPEVIVDHINPVNLWRQLDVKEMEFVFSFKNFMTYDKKAQRLLRPHYSRYYYKLLLSNNSLILKFILPFLNMSLWFLTKSMAMTLHFFSLFGLKKSLYPLYASTMQTAILKGKVVSRLNKSCLFS